MKTIKIELSLKQIFFIIFLFIIFLILNRLRDIITTFGISILLAYLFDPLIDFMESKKMGRTFSIVVVFTLFSTLCLLIIIFLFPLLYSELTTVIANFPKYFQAVAERLDSLLKDFYPGFDIEMLKSFVISKFDLISKFLLSFTKNFTSSVYSIFQSLFSLLLIPILVFYFLKDFDLIKDKFFQITNKKFDYLNVESSFYEFNEILSRYFRGQLLVSLFLAISYSVLLIIVGIEGGLLIGIISGILSLIPYLGFLVGFISSLAMAYLQYTDFLHPVYVVIGFSIIQFIESNVVTPKLVGKSLGLHPTGVIFSLMVGGYLLGIGGMIFSLPIAAFVKIYLKRKLID